MTVSSTTVETTIESSGAGQTAFVFDFPMISKVYVQVFKDEVLESTSLYTVDYIVGAQGGTIDYVVSPTTGSKITIRRTTPLSQDLQFPIAGPFPSRSHESALDKLTMIIQEMIDSDFTASGLPVGTVINSFVVWDGDTWVEEIYLTDFAIKDQVVSSVAGVVTIDYTLGQSVYLVLTEDVTALSVINWPDSGPLGQIELEILQDDPVFTVVWDASIKWPDATPPDLATVDSNHLMHLRTRDAGAKVLGTFAKDFG